MQCTVSSWTARLEYSAPSGPHSTPSKTLVWLPLQPLSTCSPGLDHPALACWQTCEHKRRGTINITSFYIFFSPHFGGILSLLQPNGTSGRIGKTKGLISKQRREGAYFPHCLIHPHKEFPQCAPANMCCSVFLCVIELAITHSSVSHWGNEGQGPQRVSWHASLSLWNTQLLMHLDQIFTHLHTTCLENTHASSSLPACFGAYKDTCPLLFWGSVNVFHR